MPATHAALSIYLARQGFLVAKPSLHSFATIKENKADSRSSYSASKGQIWHVSLFTRQALELTDIHLLNCSI